MLSFITIYILPFLCIGFLPFFVDAYDTGRFIIVTGITILMCLLWTIRLIRTKRLIVSYNAGVVGFGVLTLASLLSTIFVSTNKIEALVHPPDLSHGCSYSYCSYCAHIYRKKPNKLRMVVGVSSS